MSTLSQDQQVLETHPVRAVPISEQLVMGQFGFIPSSRTYFGSVPELFYPSVHVCYTYSFDMYYAGSVSLLMEPGSIGGDWQIRINGHQDFTPANLMPRPEHIRGSLGIDITEQLVNGKNKIEVFVHAKKPNHGLLNALYLVGEFGVILNPIAQVEQKTTGTFEDYQGNLLPYYSGIVEYELDFRVSTIPDCDLVRILFDFGSEFHEAAEVSINQGEFVPVLWQPRSICITPSQLQIGTNQLRVRVHTSLIRSFEGMYFDYKSHSYKEI